MKTLLDKIENGVVNVVKGVGKCVNDLGQDTKKLAVYGIAGAVVLTAGAGTAKATIVNGFADLVGTSGQSQVVQNYIDYGSKTGDNLMIRDSNGLASTVSKDGTDVWRIGFAKDMGGYINFGGYVKNENYWSDNFSDTLGGYCEGRFYDHVFEDGDTADDVMIIHDRLGDGIGTIDNGEWTLGTDDTPYWTEDIEFNGVQGDLSQLGTFTYTNGWKILPQMTIDAIPEPATVALLSLGALALRKRK